MTTFRISSRADESASKAADPLKAGDTRSKRQVWCGVEVRVPLDWEPGLLGRDYIRLDDAIGPVMEIKSDTVQGRFNPDRYAKSIAKRFKKAAFFAGVDDIPIYWQGAVHSLAEKQGLEASVFAWRSEQDEPETDQCGGGLGAVLHQPQTKRGLLIQFFQRARQERNELHDKQTLDLAGRVLTSLRDRSADLYVPWVVYDLQLSSPRSYELESFSFKPGHYSLTFVDKHKLLRFDLMGPADVIMRRFNLRKFADDFHSEQLKGFQCGEECKSSKVGTLDYDCLKKPTFSPSRLWTALGLPSRKPKYLRIRVRLPRGANKIASTLARSANSIDNLMFEQICKDFQIVQAQETLVADNDAG